MSKLVDMFFEKAKLKNPDADEALMFLVSEVGELADAHVHKRGGWKRNNERERNPADEAGDVYMMLDRYCQAAGLPHPEACFEAKIRKKGFLE